MPRRSQRPQQARILRFPTATPAGRLVSAADLAAMLDEWRIAKSKESG